MSNSNVFELKWGTQTPVRYTDERFGPIEVALYGTYHVP